MGAEKTVANGAGTTNGAGVGVGTGAEAEVLNLFHFTRNNNYKCALHKSSEANASTREPAAGSSSVLWTRLSYVTGNRQRAAGSGQRGTNYNSGRVALGKVVAHSTLEASAANCCTKRETERESRVRGEGR